MYSEKYEGKDGYMSTSHYNFQNVTPEIVEFSELCRKNGNINPELYTKYDVKRGLRDINGKGVLAGLTEISEIVSSKTPYPAKASFTTAAIT